jgi:hypothetical protein
VVTTLRHLIGPTRAPALAADTVCQHRNCTEVISVPTNIQSFDNAASADKHYCVRRLEDRIGENSRRIGHA